ncbi:MAG TPA: vWA domain-containing protein, partial [Planctomycetota bacterium]|nr:vWA domain-containing protein [Planctomycetota bacterium]
MKDLPFPEWLLRWLSVDVESLEGGSAEARLARFPEGEWGLIALLGVLALCGLVVWMYLREGALSRPRKLLLASFRIAIVLVLALIAFYPILEITRARDLRATTIVLLDDSLSMSIEDRYLGAQDRLQAISAFLEKEPASVATQSRAELIEEVLEREDARFFRELREKNLLRVYTFSDELRPVGAKKDADSAPGDERDAGSAPETIASPTSGDAAPSDGSAPGGTNDTIIPAVDLDPRGPRTDLARAIRQAVEAQGGGRVASVVILSDGRVTAGEGLGGIAEFLRDKGIEVHTIGVGDPSPSRNLRVTAVLTSEKVFAGDPVHVEVRLRQKGYDGETIDVSLIDHAPAPGGGVVEKVFDAQSVALEEGQEEASVHFDIELSGLGRHQLLARIEPRPEELFSDDNEDEAEVDVVEEATRVLLIAGSPSWEYRFVKNLLRRDRRVQVSAWLMSADPDYPQEGDKSLERLPTEPADLFEYDVILLLDPDPEGFPPGYAELLERFVG